MDYILYCKDCESFIATNAEIFKKYDNIRFKCGKCSETDIDEEVIIDTSLMFDKRKKDDIEENDKVKTKNRKRRKSDIKKLED